MSYFGGTNGAKRAPGASGGCCIDVSTYSPFVQIDGGPTPQSSCNHKHIVRKGRDITQTSQQRRIAGELAGPPAWMTFGGGPSLTPAPLKPLSCDHACLSLRRVTYSSVSAFAPAPSAIVEIPMT